MLSGFDGESTYPASSHSSSLFFLFTSFSNYILPIICYQDELDRQSAELIWPIPTSRPLEPCEEIRISQLDRVLPPTANHNAVVRCCTSPNETASSTSYAQPLSRTPSLRNMKSSRLRSSLPLKRQGSSTFETSHDRYPFKQKTYQPFEQSPLKTVTTSASADEEESPTADSEGRVLLPKSSSDNIGKIRSDDSSVQSRPSCSATPHGLVQHATKVRTSCFGHFMLTQETWSGSRPGPGWE
jgi:hypothetical protein